jgi:hypothetical protein
MELGVPVSSCFGKGRVENECLVLHLNFKRINGN